jgi:iron uptake system EfeUOB component EfeO/EfeM
MSDRVAQKIRSAKYKIDSVFYRSFDKLSASDKEEFKAACNILDELASEIEKQQDSIFSMPSYDINDWGKL